MSGSAPSERMVIAQKFADYLGNGTVETVKHGAGNAKRFYRVTPRPYLVIDVHYPTYIVVNGVVFRNLPEAEAYTSSVIMDHAKAA